MRGQSGIDLGLYLRAFPLLVRHPQIMLAPLLASIAQIVLFLVMPGGTGFLASANSSLSGLFAQLISSFGLAVAIVVADAAWRYGKAPFDDAWNRARDRGGDIVMASLGVSFVVYVAGLVGAIVPVVGSIGLILVATFFMMYALPAASIGGIPGGASLQISIERARAAIVPTLLLMIAYILVFDLGRAIFEVSLGPVLLTRIPGTSDAAISIVDAFVQAPFGAYVALVMAKTYDDVSYGRRFR